MGGGRGRGRGRDVGEGASSSSSMHWRRREELPIGSRSAASGKQGIAQVTPSAETTSPSSGTPHPSPIADRNGDSDGHEPTAKAESASAAEAPAKVANGAAKGLPAEAVEEEDGGAEAEADSLWPSLTPSNGAARRSASQARHEDEASDARALLRRQVRVAERKVADRTSAMASFQEEIQRLQCEAVTSIEREKRLLGEAASIREQTCGQGEAWRSGQSDLSQRTADYEGQVKRRKEKERKWRDELDAMAHGNRAVECEVAEMEKDSERWRKAKAEQAKRVSKAEAKLKSLEARRAELRSRSEALQRQVAEQEAATEAAQAHLQSITKRAQQQAPEALGQQRQWQAAAGALSLLFCWLLCMWHLGSVVETS